ncbi:MAG: hypothetical protein KAQ98_04645, partial [Bacteriovoracaceae bacterium]|nr:hypothetical protein [Bacteriovoracaceae bacterium]
MERKQDMHNENNDVINNEEDQSPPQEHSDDNKTENNDQASTQDNEKSDTRFKDGQTITMVNVRFPGNAKAHPFHVGRKKILYGQKVVAMSDRGMTVGYINSFPYDVTFNKSMLPIRSISQVATDNHLQEKNDFAEKEKEAEQVCKKLIEKHKLNMVVTHVELIQFGKKVVFYFNSPGRIDFRELVKDLVGELKMRIELRQISVRDRSSGLGAVASCGQQTCCSYFLKNSGNVSIKMAKNQNITLLPGRINGVCGQLKCCMRFENEIYSEKRSRLPKEGSLVEAVNGDRGKVTRLNIIAETFEMITERGLKRRYHHSQYSSKNTAPSDWNLSRRFDNIIDETSTVIGVPEKPDTSSCSEEQSFCEDCNCSMDTVDKNKDSADVPKKDNDEKTPDSNDDSKIKKQNRRKDHRNRYKKPNRK